MVEGVCVLFEIPGSSVGSRNRSFHGSMSDVESVMASTLLPLDSHSNVRIRVEEREYGMCFCGMHGRDRESWRKKGCNRDERRSTSRTDPVTSTPNWTSRNTSLYSTGNLVPFRSIGVSCVALRHFFKRKTRYYKEHLDNDRV